MARQIISKSLKNITNFTKSFKTNLSFMHFKKNEFMLMLHTAVWEYMKGLFE